MDVLGVALLVAALFAHARGRRTGAGVLLGLSAAVKLLGGVLVPAFRSWRTALAAAAMLVLVAVPYLGDGARLSGSLGEYGRRWRANDGAFALLHATATAAVSHTRFHKRHVMAGSPRLARLISGRDRDEVYPDEVANLAARGAAALLFFAALGFALARRLPPVPAASVTLGAFLLLTPTLHPWYVLWVVPLIALGATPAWVALAALAPLGYLPLAEYQAAGVWKEPAWTRLVVHGLTWALLLKGLIRPKPPVVSEDP
jgi:alpha-1,6-mannosyltransferase